MRPALLAALLIGCAPSASPSIANTVAKQPPVHYVVLDRPPWPSGPADIKLTWEVAAEPDHSDPDLEIMIGTVTRTLRLGEQQGHIYPGNLSACEKRMGESGPNLEYLHRTGEIAKMTLEVYDQDVKPVESTSFTVKRAPDGALQVWKVLGKLGECPPGDCLDRTMIAVIPVPPQGIVTEQVEDPSRAMGRFGCGGDDGMDR